MCAFNYTKPINRGRFRVHVYFKGYNLHPVPSSTNPLPPPRKYQTTTGTVSLTQVRSRPRNFYALWRGGGTRTKTVHCTDDGEVEGNIHL